MKGICIWVYQWHINWLTLNINIHHCWNYFPCCKSFSIIASIWMWISQRICWKLDYGSWLQGAANPGGHSQNVQTPHGQLPGPTSSPVSPALRGSNSTSCEVRSLFLSVTEWPVTAELPLKWPVRIYSGWAHPVTPFLLWQCHQAVLSEFSFIRPDALAKADKATFTAYPWMSILVNLHSGFKLKS